MTPTEVTEKLGLLRMKDRSWYCHPSNALEGDGLFEGRSEKYTCHLYWRLMLSSYVNRSVVAIPEYQKVRYYTPYCFPEVDLTNDDPSFQSFVNSDSPGSACSYLPSIPV